MVFSLFGVPWRYLKAAKCCPEGLQKGSWKLVTLEGMGRGSRKLSQALGAKVF